MQEGARPIREPVGAGSLSGEPRPGEREARQRQRVRECQGSLRGTRLAGWKRPARRLCSFANVGYLSGKPWAGRQAGTGRLAGPKPAVSGSSKLGGGNCFNRRLLACTSWAWGPTLGLALRRGRRVAGPTGDVLSARRAALLPAGTGQTKLVRFLSAPRRLWRANLAPAAPATRESRMISDFSERPSKPCLYVYGSQHLSGFKLFINNFSSSDRLSHVVSGKCKGDCNICEWLETILGDNLSRPRGISNVLSIHSSPLGFWQRSESKQFKLKRFSLPKHLREVGAKKAQMLELRTNVGTIGTSTVKGTSMQLSKEHWQDLK
ncbi:uncharacterized protein LOC118579539 [Onychomys torridus]|uniref:uncharacterized protein LOC118579539 n=1 Tax=Onychomys torridus TaxID=38674 RepID=UPI00167FCB2B|nr:uncharacterized protein LOC118579539 [Onychomys torridus]